MYMIIFDIDTNCIDEQSLGKSTSNSHQEIRKFMEVNNFTWQQGGVYFGDDTINAVHCILIVQELAKKYTWLASCSRDIRMLRIEEDADLRQVIS